MLVLLSPAKSLDFTSELELGAATKPALIDEAQKVMAQLSKKSVSQLQRLQSISEKLAQLNYQRNQEWQHPGKTMRQAVLAFTGDVYQGLSAQDWTEEDMDFANRHLRILSGLYGLLKPSDAISPYRLEMGTKMPVGKHANLYDFWKKPLIHYILEEIAPHTPVLNLASNEYFKAWQTTGAKNNVIKVEFKDKSRGTYKVISFYAKQARGLMARYVIMHRIEAVDALKEFNLGGYYFNSAESTQNKLVFFRDKAP